MISRIVNALVFQIGWMVCVLGAGRESPWSGPIVVSALVALNLWLSSHPRITTRLIFLVGLLGTLVDSILSYAGVLVFAGNPFAPWLCPPWLIALWCLFATTLNSSLQWLARRDWRASLVGAIFGPLSYVAGQTMGALRLGPGVIEGVLILAGLWAGMMPLLVRLAEKMERRARVNLSGP